MAPTDAQPLSSPEHALGTPVSPWSQALSQIIDVGRKAVARGLVVASAGNISVRDPDTGNFIVTGTGTMLDELDEGSFALMSTRGQLLAGCRPSSEWKLHHETYLRRDDINVVMHMHPETCVLLDALGAPIRAFMLDHVAYIPEIRRVPFRPNGSRELAVEAADALVGCDAVILGNHGCSVVSQSVPDAFRKVQNLEQAARMSLRATLLGDRHTEFPPELRAAAIHH